MSWRASATNEPRRVLVWYVDLVTLLLWLEQTIWTDERWSYFSLAPALFLHPTRESWSSKVRQSNRNRQHWLADRRKKLQKESDGRRFQYCCGLLDHPSEAFLHFRFHDNCEVSDYIKAKQWRRAPSNHHGDSATSSLLSSALLAIRVPRIQRTLIALLLAGIWTYNTETIVRLNLSENANTWGYGHDDSFGSVCGGCRSPSFQHEDT